MVCKKTCSVFIRKIYRQKLEFFPEENFQVRVGVSIKVRISFRVEGATRQLSQRKIDPWLGLGFGGQFSSETIVPEPLKIAW